MAMAGLDESAMIEKIRDKMGVFRMVITYATGQVPSPCGRESRTISAELVDKFGF